MTTKKKSDKKRKAWKERKKAHRKAERAARQSEKGANKPATPSLPKISAVDNARRLAELTAEVQRQRSEILALRRKLQDLTTRQQYDIRMVTSMINTGVEIFQRMINQLYHMIPRPKIPRPW